MAERDTRPNRQAERCFAVARSTTFDGERTAAISRGMAICERHGLDPDGFDIPGRSRPAVRERERAYIVYDKVDVFSPTEGELQDALDRMMAFVERQAASLGARPGETFWDARRRNFDTACAVAAATDWLREAGYLVHRTNAGWIIRGMATGYEMERLAGDQALIDRTAAIRTRP